MSRTPWTATWRALPSVHPRPTRTALMRLVEQGKVALDDPVTPLLGASPVKQLAGAKPITLRHLLTHTSGLPTSGLTVPVWDRVLPPSREDATARLEAQAPPE